MSSPFESVVIDRYPDRAAWDAEAADLVARMLDRWHLTVIDAYVGGEAGSALHVEQADGSPAVLKVGYPHVESVWEAVALDAWAPVAPAVLRQDPWTWALLLERIEPGTPLSRAELDPDEAVAIGARVLGELHRVAAPAGIPTLREHLAHFGGIAQAQLPGWREVLDRLGHRALVERAIAELPELDSGTPAFLHGDYNPGNLLAASDGGWRVVDPNPLIGDPAFDVWPLIEQLGDPWRQRDPASVIARNAAIAADLAVVDRDRLLWSGFGRAGLDVTWYLEDGELDLAARAIAKLVVLDGLR